MQIEEGKYYRTRDGRKAGPAKLHSEAYGYWDLGQDYEVCHDADGQYLDGENNPSDLVAEWTEGPVRTETVTTRRIVPGVYGLLHVNRYNGELLISFDGEKHWSAATATELDDLAMVASQLAEALRDDLD